MILNYWSLLIVAKIVDSIKCQVRVIGSNEYVGCFVDSRTRLLPHHYKLNGNNPPDMENNLCLLYCKNQRYMYAGTHNGRECWCGDDLYQYGPVDGSCNSKCYGDVEQICGGPCMLSVYETGSSDYVECFIDTRNRLLPHRYLMNDGTNPPDMENNLCLLYCKEQGYIYSGTQSGNACMCGDNPYQYGREDVEDEYIRNYDCNYDCFGDSVQICGGFWRLSVYATGYLPTKERQIRYKLVSNSSILTAPANQVLTSRSEIECALYCKISDDCKVFVTSTETRDCRLYNNYTIMCEGVQHVQGFQVYMMK